MTAATIFRKINVVDIFVQHFDTLKNVGESERNRSDFALFYAVPVPFVLLLMAYGVKLADTTIDALATALSILVGLLFNLLVLLHTLHWDKERFGNPMDKHVNQLRNELHANVAYAIVISLATLVPIVIASYYGVEDWRRTWLGFGSAYLSIHFALTMGLILKRMDALLRNRL